MITPRLRPRLEMTVPLTPAEIQRRVDQQLREPDCPCRGLATDRQIDLRIREAERHFWSPQLTVLVSPDGDGSRLTGHFGPNAELWTMFMACYGFVVLSAIAGLFFGISQLVIRETPWALWSIPIAVVLVVLIYAAAGVGQRLGQSQTEVLHDVLDHATRREQPVPRSTDQEH